MATQASHAARMTKDERAGLSRDAGFIDWEGAAMSYEHIVRGARCRVLLFALAGASTLGGGCATVTSSTAGPRPENWATPVAAHPGLPNLYRVNSSLYRSGQPEKGEFVILGKPEGLVNGDGPIKTVVSLRAFHKDAPFPAAPGIRLEHIGFKTWHPEDEDVVKFLRIVTTPELQPVLVHCQHGSDRTGTMVAIYRIAVEKWTKEQAIDEMLHGGYGFHSFWQYLLPRYIENLKVKAIQAEVEKQGPWR